MSPPTESLLAQLRTATSDLHRELDQALCLAENSITHGSYVAFLRGTLSALEPIERQLRDFGGTDALSRCALLRADLDSLNSAAPILPNPDAPKIHSLSAAYGARYVIEGSALGGAVLARSFEAALRLHGGSLRYLTLHGPQLGAHWRAFCEELEQFGRSATPSMHREACASARAVFKLYYAAFRSTGAIVVSS